MKGLSCLTSIAPSAQYRAYQLYPARSNRWVIAVGSVQVETLFTYCVEMINVGDETIPNPYVTELFLVVKGSGCARLDRKTMLLQTGDSVLISPSETQSIQNIGLDRLYVLRIMPNEAFTQQIGQAVSVELDAEDLAVLHQSSLTVSHHFPFVSSFSNL